MRVGLIVRGGVEEGSEGRNAAPIFVDLIRRLAALTELEVYSLHGENRTKVTSLYRSKAATHRFAGAEVFQLGTAPTRRLRLLGDVMRVLTAIHAGRRRSGLPDVLHGIGLSPGVVATAAGRVLRVPSVVSLIGGELTNLAEIGYGDSSTARGRAIVRTLLATADTITVASRFMQQRVSSHRARARVFPFGIDVRRFLAPVERASAPPFRILHVGTLCPLKDQLTLVAAVRRLVDAGLDVAVDIAGWDDWGGRVQREAERYGLSRWIRFHGWTSQAELAGLARAAHVFVMTSLDDAAPAAVIEAAAAGLPVVGTRVGFIADWAPGLATATPIRDPVALADALYHVLTHRDQREQMAARARDWVCAHAGLDANDAFVGLYRELVNGRAAVAGGVVPSR